MEQILCREMSWNLRSLKIKFQFFEIIDEVAFWSFEVIVASCDAGFVPRYFYEYLVKFLNHPRRDLIRVRHGAASPPSGARNHPTSGDRDALRRRDLTGVAPGRPTSEVAMIPCRP